MTSRWVALERAASISGVALLPSNGRRFVPGRESFFPEGRKVPEKSHSESGNLCTNAFAVNPIPKQNNNFFFCFSFTSFPEIFFSFPTLFPDKGNGCYLPMQNWPKILSSKSSSKLFPKTEPMCSSARFTSTAINSSEQSERRLS